MTDRQLIKKIKKLEKIQPSSKWLDFTRYNLVRQIDFEKRDDARVWGFFNWFKEPQLAALVICLVLIFVGGPWLMIKASQASLPGEVLYSVKKISEEVQTTVASENTKTKLQVEFAGRRLEELSKITEDSLSPEEKGEKAKEVISDFKDKLADASLHVGKISREEAVVMAKKAKKIREELEKTKEEVSLEIQTELAEAEKAIEEISHQILTVLTKKSQEIEETATTTLDKEILIFLEETDLGTMTTTEEVINEIKE